MRGPREPREGGRLEGGGVRERQNDEERDKETWEGEKRLGEEDEERFKKEIKQFSMRGNNRQSH